VRIREKRGLCVVLSEGVGPQWLAGNRNAGTKSQVCVHVRVCVCARVRMELGVRIREKRGLCVVLSEGVGPQWLAGNRNAGTKSQVCVRVRVCVRARQNGVGCAYKREKGAVCGAQ